MQGHRVSRLALSASGALLLSAVAAGAVGAVTWDPPVTLSSAEWANATGVVALSGGDAVALFESGNEPTSVATRRTTDSGVSWEPPVMLSSDADGFSAISGRGSKVDVVYRSGGRVRYQRSVNGGVSFEPAVALSPVGKYAMDPDVARGPGGIVAVIWGMFDSGKVRVRVSADGGVSFAPALTLATIADDLDSSIAVGRGFVVAAYVTDAHKVRVRRSLDKGVNWSSATPISTLDYQASVDLAAAGRKAVLVFTGANSGAVIDRVRIARSDDRGRSWGSPLALGPTDQTTFRPHASLRNGVTRVVFGRCTTDWDVCADSRVLYRKSNDGVHWTRPRRVSPSSLSEAFPGGVDYTGDVIVVYTGYSPDGAYARRGS